jgi:hypothetical protein
VADALPNDRNSDFSFGATGASGNGRGEVSRPGVDLKSFECSSVTSSFVRRVCFDQQQSYMLIQLNETWYHYCGIDEATVSFLVRAESVGRFYNSGVKGRSDCRGQRVPQY